MVDARCLRQPRDQGSRTSWNSRNNNIELKKTPEHPSQGVTTFEQASRGAVRTGAFHRSADPGLRYNDDPTLAISIYARPPSHLNGHEPSLSPATNMHPSTLQLILLWLGSWSALASAAEKQANLDPHQYEKACPDYKKYSTFKQYVL